MPCGSPAGTDCSAPVRIGCLPVIRADRVGTPVDDELTMLDATPAPRQTHSRLCCQIVMRPELDGLVVSVPAA